MSKNTPPCVWRRKTKREIFWETRRRRQQTRSGRDVTRRKWSVLRLRRGRGDWNSRRPLKVARTKSHRRPKSRKTWRSSRVEAKPRYWRWGVWFFFFLLPTSWGIQCCHWLPVRYVEVLKKIKTREQTWHFSTCDTDLILNFCSNWFRGFIYWSIFSAKIPGVCSNCQ